MQTDIHTLKVMWQREVILFTSMISSWIGETLPQGLLCGNWPRTSMSYIHICVKMKKSLPRTLLWAGKRNKQQFEAQREKNRMVGETVSVNEVGGVDVCRFGRTGNEEGLDEQAGLVHSESMVQGLGGDGIAVGEFGGEGVCGAEGEFGVCGAVGEFGGEGVCGAVETRHQDQHDGSMDSDVDGCGDTAESVVGEAEGDRVSGCECQQGQAAPTDALRWLHLPEAVAQATTMNDLRLLKQSVRDLQVRVHELES